MTNSTLIPLNEKAKKFVSTPLKMFIDGEWVESVSEERMDIFDPSTKELVAQVPKGNTADVDLAVKAARKAFDEGSWVNMKPNDRAVLLLKLADVIEQNAEELAHLETLDTGRPINFSYFVVSTCVEQFRYYAGWATKVTGETIPVSTPGNVFNYTRREPLGVCVGITAWNGPLSMAVMKLAAPLAVGNTCIIKPASETPLATLRLAELIEEVGFPKGVVNIITGPGSVIGDAFTTHPSVDKISFTGSTEVGRSIMRNSASTIKKVTLELGGKSAHIIFDDADYEQAIQNAANGIFMNTGQACFAGSRLFVHKNIYDRFVKDLAEYTKNYKIGNGFDPNTVLGPIITASQKETILNYIDIAKKEGAELIFGGNATSEDLSKGNFVQPTILARCNNNMRVAREEIFGPVVAAIPFETVEEVIAMANDTEYGLGGGICTTDVKKAHKVAHALRTGNVWINTYGLMDPASPFGGYKASGIGRENGAASIDMFTEIKNVWVNLD